MLFPVQILKRERTPVLQISIRKTTSDLLTPQNHCSSFLTIKHQEATTNITQQLKTKNLTYLDRTIQSNQDYLSPFLCFPSPAPALAWG
ncbi:hypothetical protein H4Q26_002998 [Puccinia striiformis f. sp. tritici PST-130]|nr:hypothetical protein H4Q26_002998 [Puccinia striiformis f. sp. tritici PST-130]